MRRRVPDEPPLGIAQQTAGRPDPKSSFAVLGKDPAMLMDHRRSVRAVEDRESQSVEARQSLACAYPQISVRGLRYVLDAIVRQAFQRRPRLTGELLEVSA